MRIVIPEWVDRSITWIASWMPPPKPIGVKVFGREITWLDVFVVGVGALMIAAYAVYYGHWLHAVMGALCFVLAWMIIEWVL